MADFELDDFDFGFTTHSNTEFIQADEAEEKTTRANNEAQLMYDAILPLLNNLVQDAEKKEFIHWPDRRQKIEQFKEKLNAILNTSP